MEEDLPGRCFPAYAAIFFAAFILRIIFLSEIFKSPLFFLLINDAYFYDLWAMQIAGGDWLGNMVFYQAPLYPYFLGGLYSLVGHDLVFVRVVQITIGAGSCVITALAGRYFFSKKAGIAAGFFLAFYPTAIYFDFIIQKCVLTLFFSAVLLLVLGKQTRRPKVFLWLAAGAVLGCFGLVRENSLILAPVVSVWIFLYFSYKPLKVRAIWCLVFAIGLALVLFPVALRNKNVGGEFFLTTSQFGPNFYMGNNPKATGTYMSLIKGRSQVNFERSDAVKLAETELGRRLTPSEVSRFWTKKSLDYIRHDTIDWLALVRDKCFLYWNAIEIPDTECQYVYARHSIVLKWLGKVFHFGVVCPLAVFGLCLTFGDRKKLCLLYLIGASLAAGAIMFYIFSRYRYPIMPVIMLFAGVGLVRGAALFARREFKIILFGLSISAIAAFFINLPGISPKDVSLVPLYNFGAALSNKGRYEMAAKYFEQALQIDPDYGFAHYDLGQCLLKMGMIDKGLQHISRYIELYPVNPKAHLIAGNTCILLNRFEKAIWHFRQVIDLDSSYANAAYNNLAIALNKSGNPDQAIIQMAEALRLDPNDYKGHFNMAKMLVEQGQIPEAVKHYKTALALEPGFEAAQLALDDLL